MEKIKKQKVRYEFYNFVGDLILPNKQYNLKVENPAEIRFLVVAPVGTNSNVIINNVYTLSNFYQSNNALFGVTPYELILKNHLNEIDVTNYSINIFGPDTTCIITCKYYVNS